MFKKVALVAVISIMLFVGFGNSMAQDNSDPMTAILQMQYVRDPRNGLCFGLLRPPARPLFDGDSGSQPRIVIRVPCKRVKDQLIQEGAH